MLFGTWRSSRSPGCGTSPQLRAVVRRGAGARLSSAGLATDECGPRGGGQIRRYLLAEGALHVISILTSFVVVMALFAMKFKWLPDVSVGSRDVWLGAFLTALFFEIGKAAIGFYIGKQGLESTYGAAASIVVVLIWVYYTSQIILMGAEVTHSYAKHNCSFKRREPDEAPENLRPLSQSRPARNRERRSSSRTG